MKFNVNGAMRGCPTDADIKGVMRNENGEVKVTFSKFIDVGDANFVELPSGSRLMPLWSKATL